MRLAPLALPLLLLAPPLGAQPFQAELRVTLPSGPGAEGGERRLFGRLDAGQPSALTASEAPRRVEFVRESRAVPCPPLPSCTARTFGTADAGSSATLTLLGEEGGLVRVRVEYAYASARRPDREQRRSPPAGLDVQRVTAEIPVPRDGETEAALPGGGMLVLSLRAMAGAEPRRQLPQD